MIMYRLGELGRGASGGRDIRMRCQIESDKQKKENGEQKGKGGGVVSSVTPFGFWIWTYSL